MNLNLNFGKDKNGKDIFIDLQKEKIHTTLLTGTTGSGKSILHYWLYKQIMETNTLDDVRFLFMDMTQVDFVGWKTPYLYKSTIVLAEQGLDELEKISTMDFKDSALIIHIEECSMVAYDQQRFERIWGAIHENMSNIYAVFSTSRPSSDIFTSQLKNTTDMNISFVLSSEKDSVAVLGKSLVEKFQNPGEKVIIYHGQEIQSDPFSEDIVNEINNFDKKMGG